MVQRGRDGSPPCPGSEKSAARLKKAAQEHFSGEEEIPRQFMGLGTRKDMFSRLLFLMACFPSRSHQGFCSTSIARKHVLEGGGGRHEAGYYTPKLDFPRPNSSFFHVSCSHPLLALALLVLILSASIVGIHGPLPDTGSLLVQGYQSPPRSHLLLSSTEVLFAAPS